MKNFPAIYDLAGALLFFILRLNFVSISEKHISRLKMEQINLINLQQMTKQKWFVTVFIDHQIILEYHFKSFNKWNGESSLPYVFSVLIKSTPL